MVALPVVAVETKKKDVMVIGSIEEDISEHFVDPDKNIIGKKVKLTTLKEVSEYDKNIKHDLVILDRFIDIEGIHSLSKLMDENNLNNSVYRLKYRPFFQESMSQRDISDIQERIKEICCKNNSLIFDPHFYAHFKSVTEKLNKNLETALQNMIDMTKLGGEMIIIPSVCPIGSKNLDILNLNKKHGCYGFLVFTDFFENNPSDPLVRQIIATACLLKNQPYRKYLDSHTCIKVVSKEEPLLLPQIPDPDLIDPKYREKYREYLQKKDLQEYLQKTKDAINSLKKDGTITTEGLVRTDVSLFPLPISSVKAPHIHYEKIGNSEKCEGCKASAKPKIVEAKN